MAKKKRFAPPLYTLATHRGKEHKFVHFAMYRLEDLVEERERATHPHRHDCFVIVFITQGVGFHGIDTEHYPMKPFSFFFLTPGQVHHISFSKDVRGFAIYFNLAFYLNYSRERHLEKFPFFRALYSQSFLQLNPQADIFLVALLDDMMHELLHSHAGSEEILRNSLDTILIRMTRYYKNATAIQGPLSSALQIRKLQGLIDRKFKELKRPGDYAEKMHMSSQHLNTICKHSLNKTVTDLIHERIITEAKRLLAYSDLGVKQVANTLGFHDKSYFQRFFKKITSLTPDEFRRSIPVTAHRHLTGG